MLEKAISNFYSKTGKIFCKNFSEIITSMLSSSSSNTAKIAIEMSKLNNKSFKTNDIALYRFLKNEKFQIDEALWRCHIKMIFTLLKEHKIIKNGDKIPIKIDFTTSEDNFLILCASIIVADKAIPIFFTMRRYPVRKDMIDQKRMERAFLKCLKNFLSQKYHYIIVADRGFGNERIVNYCEEFGYEYLLRITSSIKIEHEKNEVLLSEIKGNKSFVARIIAWKRNIKFFVAEKDGQSWYLITNIPDISHTQAVDMYKKRFKIEKTFQDLKSSGFDIENLKIKKYDRFKRMAFCSVIAYSLMILTGDFINKKVISLKKNSPTFLELISVYFKLPEELLLHSS
jgi:hypothetical protein